MIIRSWKEYTPQIHPTARLAENVTVIGDVHLCENTNIWYGTVLRGDSGPMWIGAGSNVQDNCVLHCEFDGSLTVGQNVTAPFSTAAQWKITASSAWAQRCWIVP